jgi:hypothetical protein
MAIKLKYQKHEIPKDLDLLREQLYKGAYSDIANATGYSIQYVIQVIHGDRKNNVIIEATRELIDQLRETLNDINVRFHRSTYVEPVLGEEEELDQA